MQTKEGISGMKMLFIILLAVLLAGCEQTTAPTTESTTEPTTQSTTAPATKPTTAPTTVPTETTAAFTEPNPTVLHPKLWLTDSQYPSYEEFLATEPEMTPITTDSWLVTDGNTAVMYRLGMWNLEVKSSVSDLVYPIPNAEALQSYSAMATDGEHVYMQKDTEILKVELLTGKVVGTLPTGKILIQHIVENFAMYYVEYDGENFNYCLAYLPEMKQAVLDTFEAPEKVYPMRTHYTDGSMRWVLLNPVMLELLEKELQNPDSPYKTPTVYGEKVDFSDFWNSEILWNEYLSERYLFLYSVQEMSGIRATVEYHYHMEDGSLTTRTGIIDNCFFGTGQLHDHYVPEITEIPGPSVVNGSWKMAPGQDIQGELTPKPSGDFSVEQYSFGAGPEKLYLCQNGQYTEFADIAFQKKSSQEDAIYGTTADNKILQLSYDGTVCNTLYTGTDISNNIVILENSVYFVDGDELLQLDMATNQYRVLIKQKYLNEVGLRIQDNKTLICFNAYAGLAWNQHGYNIETGQVETITGMW